MALDFLEMTIGLAALVTALVMVKWGGQLGRAHDRFKGEKQQ